jgi:hypothetical protein
VRNRIFAPFHPGKRTEGFPKPEHLSGHRM